MRLFKKNTSDKSSSAIFGRMAVRDRFADISEKVDKKNPIIVECGASTGPIIEKYLSLFDDPIVYAFEPQPKFVEILTAKFSGNPNIHIFRKAVGASNDILQFNVLSRNTSSSFLNPTPTNKNYHPEEMERSSVIEVEQVRIDKVIQDSQIDLLKLDLQGYELEALKGCEKVLDKIKIITTEIEFIPLYEGQPLFGDIDAFLRNNHFCLFNLYELYTQKDGQLTAGDAIYLNTKYYSQKLANSSY
ncbi:MAG: FkbM family methyltransferase [Bacteroidota bacterium]